MALSDSPSTGGSGSGPIVGGVSSADVHYPGSVPHLRQPTTAFDYYDEGY